MKRFATIICLALAIVFTQSSAAQELPRVARDHFMVKGGNPSSAKAGGDTINLMAARTDPTNNMNIGSCSLEEPYYDGDFESYDKTVDWHGWKSQDLTAGEPTHWNISEFNQTGGNKAAWCGGLLDLVGGGQDNGYGNNWYDVLEFRWPVADTTEPTWVTVSASLQYDSEAGKDFTYLSYQYEGQEYGDYHDVDSWSGTGAVTVTSDPIRYLPEHYVDGTDVAIYWRFESDGAWSDEDGSYQGNGGCQVDNIMLAIDNEGQPFEIVLEDFDFKSANGDLGLCRTVTAPGVGDFAQIWENLDDGDQYHNNHTAQVAFIDDGVVVPGTGGTQGISWSYGPGGYIVNNPDGLAGQNYHIHNAIESPVMTWPEPKNCGDPVLDGILLTFTVYRHEDLVADSPGTFYTWAVRSADVDDSAGNGAQDITQQPWLDRGFVYYGSPDYIRAGDDVTDLMNPGRDQVQVQLTVYQLGWVWGWDGSDGSPAPYFDNVTVKVFPTAGPSMSAREIDLAQDNFPARGDIDYDDLSSHSVRFDMANNISPSECLRNDPGDSVVADIVSVRAGADLVGSPTLNYLLKRNPVFDAGRTAGLLDQGSISGSPAVGPGGTPDPRKWAFDLPDTGFFFPGDVLHYYIEATDQVGGSDQQTSLMPADTTGFSTGFGDPMGYHSSFTVRALPSIVSDGHGGYAHPPVLFLNDFGSRGGEDEWYSALNNIGLLIGEDYDAYYVNGPSSGVGNGIGGRASLALVYDYDDMLYTCGDLGVYTICNGDYLHDAGDDVGLLSGWLELDDKDIFLTGDNLVSDMWRSGTTTLEFVEVNMGLDFIQDDVRPLIGNQSSPRVKMMEPTPINPDSPLTWIAYGGYPSRNTFDAVEITPPALRIAEFLDPSGLSQVYGLSAMTMKTSYNFSPGTSGSRVISMPYDFMFIQTDPLGPPSLLPARARILRDILQLFGVEGDANNVSGTADTPVIRFTTSNYPNPFNPSTTIEYSMPSAGHLKLSIYNVRGQLVKTLIDGVRPAGADQAIIWDGTDNLGSAVSSGIYFYEARTGGEVKVKKMALVK